MKLEINTVTKTLKVLSSVSIEDLMAYIKEHGMEDWTIETKDESIDLCKEFYTRGPSYIPTDIPKIDPYSPPYIVTCSTT